MTVYVVISLDNDVRLRECYVFTELAQAQDAYQHLRKLYGGRFAALASRAVDAPPYNLYDNCILEIQQEM